jgi:hypothetical protein
MKAELADYILKLQRAYEKTRQAEDRTLYQRYLAEAGVLLALVETDADHAIISAAVESHERLWGNTWLQDDAYRVPSEAWGSVKRKMAGR